MTPFEMRDLMYRHKLTGPETSRMVGYCLRQVRAFMSGKHKVPLCVSLILQAYDEGKIDAKWIVTHLPESR